jgi:hypothetical protein
MQHVACVSGCKPLLRGPLGRCRRPLRVAPHPSNCRRALGCKPRTSDYPFLRQVSAGFAQRTARACEAPVLLHPCGFAAPPIKEAPYDLPYALSPPPLRAAAAPLAGCIADTCGLPKTLVLSTRPRPDLHGWTHRSTTGSPHDLPCDKPHSPMASLRAGARGSLPHSAGYPTYPVATHASIRGARRRRVSARLDAATPTLRST